MIYISNETFKMNGFIHLQPDTAYSVNFTPLSEQSHMSCYTHSSCIYFPSNVAEKRMVLVLSFLLQC